MCMVYILVNYAFVFGMESAFLSWYVFGKLFCGHVGFKGPAKSRTHEPSWGLSDVSGMLLGIAPLGAVTMVGGSSNPSVPWSPGVTLQEKAGRPMGPSTLRCEFPWEVVVVSVGFWFFALQVFLPVLCAAVVISRGSVFFLAL